MSQICNKYLLRSPFLLKLKCTGMNNIFIITQHIAIKFFTHYGVLWGSLEGSSTCHYWSGVVMSIRVRYCRDDKVRVRFFIDAVQSFIFFTASQLVHWASIVLSQFVVWFSIVFSKENGRIYNVGRNTPTTQGKLDVDLLPNAFLIAEPATDIQLEPILLAAALDVWQW